MDVEHPSWLLTAMGLTRAVAAGAEPETIYLNLIDAVLKMLDAEGAFVGGRHPVTGSLQEACGSRLALDPIDGDLPASRTVLQECLDTGLRHVTDNAGADRRWEDVIDGAALRGRPAAVLPIRTRGVVRAALLMVRRGGAETLTDADLEVLDHLCDIAGSGLPVEARGPTPHEAFMQKVDDACRRGAATLLRAEIDGDPAPLAAAAPKGTLSSVHANQLWLLLPRPERGFVDTLRKVAARSNVKLDHVGLASLPADADSIEALVLAVEGPSRDDAPAPPPREIDAVRRILPILLETPQGPETALGALCGVLDARAAWWIPGGEAPVVSFGAGGAPPPEHEDGWMVKLSLDGRGRLIFHDPEPDPATLPVRRLHAEMLAEAFAESLDASKVVRREEEQRRRRRAETERLVGELQRKFDFAGIVAHSEPMLDVLKMVARAAPTEAPVLIVGESGTGKELLARAIAANSPRRDKPVVAINCAAIPANLMESELFGHVRGAFTGAVADRKGVFELADGGTLFLDEVVEIPLEVQAKLLRALQFGEIQKVGSDSVTRVKARVVAATNRPPSEVLAQKKFREDLYYRLNVFAIEVPPLRARRDDLDPLIDHILQRVAKEARRGELILAPDAREALHRHRFPGNIRELENILTRAAAMSAAGTVTAAELPPEVHGRGVVAGDETPPGTRDELERRKGEAIGSITEQMERAFVEHALRRARGNVSKAAELAEINRTSLHRLIAKYALNPKTYHG